MDEQLATSILSKGPYDESVINDDDSLHCISWYLSWNGEEEASLDGTFTAEQLKAIAWWMENKKVRD